MTSLGSLLLEVQSGFACGKQDEGGVFQFRMHNVSKSSELTLEKRRRVPRDAHKQIERFVVEPGDVLFNATNSPDGVGKSILIPELDEPAVFSNHFLRLRADPERLDPAYLWRWLQWMYQRGTFRGMTRQWVNQATVSRDDLLAIDVAPPSLDEQRRIAEILDHADALRAKRRRVLAHLDDLTQSIFHAMFGDLDDARWQRRPLGELAYAIDSGKSPKCESRVAQPDEWGVLKLGAVTYGVYQESENKAYHGDVGSMTSNEVRAGDVLMTRKNTRELVGAVALVEDTRPRLLLPDLIFRLHLDVERIDRHYFQALMMNMRKRPAVRDLSSGSAGSMPNISKARLRTLPIELPPMKTQTEFANRVTHVNAQRVAVERALAADDELFASLQSRAFSGGL